MTTNDTSIPTTDNFNSDADLDKVRASTSRMTDALGKFANVKPKTPKPVATAASKPAAAKPAADSASDRLIADLVRRAREHGDERAKDQAAAIEAAYDTDGRSAEVEKLIVELTEHLDGASAKRGKGARP